MKEWPTKYKDMHAAEQIMEQYANSSNKDALGLFELVVNQKEKRMNFRISSWVVMLAQHFKSEYGAMEGELVTRKVLTCCMINGQTLH